MKCPCDFLLLRMHIYSALLLVTLVACSPVGVTTTQSLAQSQGGSSTGLSMESPSSATAQVGEQFALQPVVHNPAGETLTFRISGKPAWTAFDAKTGVLSGTPAAADVGSYGNIVIVVNNGTDNVSLGPLSISVVSAGTGVATLSWLPPTQNTDRSPLTDMAGYRVYYGTNRSSLTRSQQIADPSVTTHVFSTLLPGTWYFAVSAYNSAGAESSLSNIGSKVIPP
jgi:hypothetical protein